MRDFAAAKSEMGEYWYIRPGLEESVNGFFSAQPEADMALESQIPEKDFNQAGKGSAEVKNLLKRLGVNPGILRRVAVAAYEAEINVAAHSLGGTMMCRIYDEFIHIIFKDMGPGIADIEQAMTRAIPQQMIWCASLVLARDWGCRTSRRIRTLYISSPSGGIRPCWSL